MNKSLKISFKYLQQQHVYISFQQVILVLTPCVSMFDTMFGNQTLVIAANESRYYFCDLLNLTSPDTKKRSICGKPLQPTRHENILCSLTYYMYTGDFKLSGMQFRTIGIANH